MSNRGHWTFDAEGKLVPFVKARASRTIHIITDEIPGGIMSHGDCKMYTSKAALRRSYKEQGFIEYGDQELPEPQTRFNNKQMQEEYEKKLMEDIEQAYYQCHDGMAPITELERERFKTIDKMFEENNDGRERDEYGRLRE